MHVHWFRWLSINLPLWDLQLYIALNIRCELITVTFYKTSWISNLIVLLLSLVNICFAFSEAVLAYIIYDIHIYKFV